MPYSVKQISEMSGVSVRTLHFYDETALLKPAYVAANGYRFYEEPQLLRLQQILFYRELGFKLKDIREIASRKDFENVAALQSHREVLEETLNRTRLLLATIERTISRMQGETAMKDEELFSGFCVAAGQDRFQQKVKLGGEPNDCKVSSRDTAGALCIFEFNGTAGGPRQSHRQQDEWIYVVEGEIVVELGQNESRHLSSGESVFIPRQVCHAWLSVGDVPAKIINLYQPSGKMEQFFSELGKFRDHPVHEVLTVKEMKRMFEDHGMELLGPPLAGDWAIGEDGRAMLKR